MPKSITITRAFNLYRLDYIAMKNQSAKTDESYVCASNLLVRHFGDIDITTITFENVRDWRSWLSTWQKPDTIRNNICCLRMVLKFLSQREYKVLNYNEIPVAKREKRTVEYLDEQEMEVFIAEAGKSVRGYTEENRLRNVAIVTLLYATGLRISELCSLNRNSIKNRMFTIVGKSKEPRIGFIDPETEKIINNYLAARTDSDKALFISYRTGKRITADTVRKVFKNICDRSEFENIHPHTIRHSYATKLLTKRVDIRYIGDLMGHVSLDTTKIYTHYSNPALQDIYDKAHNLSISH